MIQNSRMNMEDSDIEVIYVKSVQKFKSRQSSPTSIERNRLEEINGRCTRLIFQGTFELPPLQTILDLSPHIVGIVEAKFHAPSCFCIFTDKKRKDLAEKLLDGLRFRRGHIAVDPDGKLVPVDINDLENTREVCTLAVHGIGRNVTENDLRRVFPGVNYVRIALRGGTAFLTYRHHEASTRAFLEAEDTRVRGYRVQVLFGHTIAKNDDDRISNEVALEAFDDRRLTECPADKTVVKSDITLLLSALHGAGINLEQLQTDYVRKGRESRTELDVKIDWMDRLKVNSRNQMSESTRKVLVDNVWEFLENDDCTQRQIALKSLGTRNAESHKKRLIAGENSPKRDYERSKRKNKSDRENDCSPEKKKQKNENNAELSARFRKYCYVMDARRNEEAMAKSQDAISSSRPSLRSNNSSAAREKSVKCDGPSSAAREKSVKCDGPSSAAREKSVKCDGSERDKNNNAELCARFRQYCNVLDNKRKEVDTSRQKNAEAPSSVRSNAGNKKDISIPLNSNEKPKLQIEESVHKVLSSDSKTNFDPPAVDPSNTMDVSSDILDIDDSEIDLFQDDVVDNGLLDEEDDVNEHNVDCDTNDDDLLNLILDEEEQSQLLRLDKF